MLPSSRLKWLNQPDGMILSGLSVIAPAYFKPEDISTVLEPLSLTESKKERVLKNLKNSTPNLHGRYKLAKD